MKNVALNNRKDRPSVLPSENQPPTANISSLNLSNKAGTSASNIHQEAIEDEHRMEMVSGDTGVKNSQQRCLPLLEPAISGTGNCVINSSQTAHSDLYEELKNSSYDQVLLIIATCIMEMRNEMKDMKDMKNDIKDMKIDIKDMKRDINSIKRNIGCLYEGQVLIHLEKASDMLIENPFWINKKQFPAIFKTVAQNNGQYTGMILQLYRAGKLSEQSFKALLLDTDNVEINFIRREKATPRRLQIFEATISTLSNENKLLTKLVQIERQVIFYSACYCNEEITGIGIVAPTTLELGHIGCVASQYPGLMHVNKFISMNAFKVIRQGNKPELF